MRLREGSPPVRRDRRGWLGDRSEYQPHLRAPRSIGGLEPRPQPPARPPRGVARDSKRQAEIIYAQDIPALARRHGDRGGARNVPAVVLEAADQAIAGGVEKAVPRQIADVILEQDQARPPAREIESAEYLELVALDVDGEEIEAGRRLRLDQDIVERAHGNLDDPLGLGARRHAVAIERRQGAGDMKAHRAAGVLRRRAGDGVYLGRPPAPQLVRELGLRLDQDAGPAELFEMPGLRFLLRPVGADLDEETGARGAEKLAHQLLLASRASRHAHGSSTRQRRARLADDRAGAEAGHELDEDDRAAVGFD